MTRWVFRRFGGPIEADAVTSDALQPGAVRLRVLACGVCHTDIHTWEGRYDLGGGRELDLSGRVKLPLALGHEVAGEVVEILVEDGTPVEFGQVLMRIRA